MEWKLVQACMVGPHKWLAGRKRTMARAAAVDDHWGNRLARTDSHAGSEHRSTIAARLSGWCGADERQPGPCHPWSLAHRAGDVDCGRRLAVAEPDAHL